MNIFKKRESTIKEYTLNRETVDSVVREVTQFSIDNGIDKAGANKYGFLVDDTLFTLLESGHEGETFSVLYGYRFLKPFVAFRIAGEEISFKSKRAGFGNFQNSLLVNEGCLPGYSYSDGVNQIVFNLRKKPEMIKTILCVLCLAVAVALLTDWLVPETVLLTVAEKVTGPLTGMFYNLLRCVSGPMVFLSVVWGIAGVGNQVTFGKIGKKVMAYSGLVTLAGALVGCAFIGCFGLDFSGSASGAGQFSSLFEMIIGIVPSNVVEPFSSGNTLQIILLAIVVGVALVAIRSKTSDIFKAVEQVNNLVNYIMTFVSKLVPVIVFLLCLNIVWQKTYSLVTSTWRFFAVMIGAFILTDALIVAVTSIRFKVNPFRLAWKNITTFVISFTTASSAAAFSDNISNAKKKFGIDADLAGFAVPLGMIVHNPIAACYNIIILLYFASVYGVKCSVGWILIGVIVSTVVAISSPPIPGGASICYAMLFAQMGIPDEALVVAIVLDVVTDFFVTAFETHALPISMTNIAGSLKMLDRDKLKK